MRTCYGCGSVVVGWAIGMTESDGAQHFHLACWKAYENGLEEIRILTEIYNGGSR